MVLQLQLKNDKFLENVYKNSKISFKKPINSSEMHLNLK
jgi:hypothetical protein